MIISGTNSFAQKAVSSYTNGLDALISATDAPKIQYFLGSEIILTKDGKPQEVEISKKGKITVIDRRIFFEKGLPGVLDHVDSTNGPKVIWIRYQKKVKGQLSSIAVPFMPSGTGRDNCFAVQVPKKETGAMSDPGPANSFTYEDHSYTVSGTAPLQVDDAFKQALINARKIIVRNR